MSRNPRNLAAVLAALAVAVIAPSAPAASISIVNPSFEDPVLAENGFAPATGWTATSFMAGNFDDAAFSGATDDSVNDNLVIPDGRNVFVVASTTGNYVTQILSTNYALGEQYTLTAWFGIRKDEAAGYSGQAFLQLLRGDNQAVLAQTVLVSGPSDRDTFEQVTVLYTSTIAGVPIEVRALMGSPNGQFSVDLVSLTTPEAVPAPAALPAGLALMLAATLRRRPHRSA